MLNTQLTVSNLNFLAYRNPAAGAKLNLVSLMDIFTILVFFLLLNNGDSNQLENAKFIKLPDSSAIATPHVEATLVIGVEQIWLNNEPVLTVDEVLNSSTKIITPLAEVLSEYAEKRGELSSYEKDNGMPITIMGDQSVSFSLLERVMATCSAGNFRDISLAVNRVAAQSFLIQAETPPSMATDNNDSGEG